LRQLKKQKSTGCLNGQMLIYVKKEAAGKPVTVKLSSPLLESAELNIE
jgi:hypothetical protein